MKRWPFRRKDALEALPDDDEFWREFREVLAVALTPAILEGFILGWELAFTHTPKGKPRPIARPPDVGEEFVESAARRYLAARMPTIERIAENTRIAIRDEILRIRTEGGTVADLYDELEPLLGPQRAELVAVTELTNAMGRAAQEAYKAAGFQFWMWQTANDDRVDGDCASKNGQVYGIEVLFEAEHPRCRCWASPAGVAA